LIRTAHAAGVEFVLVTRERSAPLGGTAAKAAAGALSLVDISQVTNLTDALQACKDAGAWVFGAVKERNAQSIYETDFNLPACIVIGNEGRGIRPLVRRTCDVLISIPMAGELDSLNSSVAGAVIMFEMHRQKLAALHNE
jgi:23S rRNA (guanosine2251-2'-O)-methyltransferase